MQTLSVGNIISGAMKIGKENMGTILSAGVLWILTIWIPYLNVGTTIAMFNMVVKLGRGESFAPMEIFDKEYRTNMGEFFLLYGLMFMGIIVGLMFAVIPGIILAFAWSQAFFLMEDRNLTPLEAIRASNRITYGDKWNMFLGVFVLQLAIIIAFLLLTSIFGNSSAISGLVSIITYLATIVVSVSAYAYIYGALLPKMEGNISPAAHDDPHPAFA